MKKKAEYIEQGYVSGVHGIKGELKLKVWCDDMSGFYKIKHLYFDENGNSQYNVLSSRGSKEAAVVKLQGIDTPEQAEKFRGKTLFVKRSELNIPDDRILVCDLIGLPVIDFDNGKQYGTLESIEEYPASDVYVVKTEKGLVQVPDVVQFIKKLTDEAIYISVIEGMFE